MCLWPVKLFPVFAVGSGSSGNIPRTDWSGLQKPLGLVMVWIMGGRDVENNSKNCRKRWKPD